MWSAAICSVYKKSPFHTDIFICTKETKIYFSPWYHSFWRSVCVHSSHLTMCTLLTESIRHSLLIRDNARLFRLRLGDQLSWTPCCRLTPAADSLRCRMRSLFFPSKPFSWYTSNPIAVNIFSIAVFALFVKHFCENSLDFTKDAEYFCFTVLHVEQIVSKM